MNNASIKNTTLSLLLEKEIEKISNKKVPAEYGRTGNIGFSGSAFFDAVQSLVKIPFFSFKQQQTTDNEGWLYNYSEITEFKGNGIHVIIKTGFDENGAEWLERVSAFSYI